MHFETFDDEPDPFDQVETAAAVECPWCGEMVDLTLDPGGGSDQEYVEDCAVCCRPMQVHVRYLADGVASIDVQQGG
jgi:hypothetical protein